MKFNEFGQCQLEIETLASKSSNTIQVFQTIKFNYEMVRYENIIYEMGGNEMVRYETRIYHHLYIHV